MRLSLLVLTALLAGGASAAAQTKVLRFASVVDGSGRVIPERSDRRRRRPHHTHRRRARRRSRRCRGRGPHAIHGNSRTDRRAHAHHLRVGSGVGHRPMAPAREVRRGDAAGSAREWDEGALESGVTTVRDLGASGYRDLALRDSIDRAGWIGPRVFAAGYGLPAAQAESEQHRRHHALRFVVRSTMRHRFPMP